MSAGRAGARERVAIALEPVLEALLEDGPAVAVPAQGHSMRPTILPGDRLVVAPFLGLPRPGQIVLVRRDGILVAHRLIDVEITPTGRLYRLQGDGEIAPDRPVRRQEILGRITAVVRQGRRLPIDESPKALRRALSRLALRRRRLRLLRGAAVLLIATASALGVGAATLNPPAETFAPPPDYQFAPGDVLSLRIWDGHKIDEAQLTVQSDGSAFLPIPGFGTLELGGRTAPEAKRDIEARLRRIYKEIYTELLVLRYAGHRVHLMGEVRTTARDDSGPGDWPLSGPTRLVSFLSEHGGATQEADLMRVRLVRRDGAVVEANLFRAVFQQSEADNPALQDGDFIFIPSLQMGSRKVYVLGEVNQPGVVTIYDTLNLVEALARCGGISRRGDLKEIVVLKRAGSGDPEMRIADIKALYKEAAVAQNLALDPGDIVYVPKGAIGTLQDVFSIISPALQTIESLYIIDSFRDD